MKRVFLLVSVLIFGLNGCAMNEGFGGLLTTVAGLFTGTSATKSDLETQSRLFAAKMDGENNLAPKDNKYSQRLEKLTAGLTQVDGTPLNFGVYLVGDINAFAK